MNSEREESLQKIAALRSTYDEETSKRRAQQSHLEKATEDKIAELEKTFEEDEEIVDLKAEVDDLGNDMLD